MVLDVIEPYLGEIIIGLTFLGLKYLEKGTLKDALGEFVSFAWDKDKIKDSAVLSALTVEANKHHGKEIEGPPPETNLPTKKWLETQFKTLAKINKDTQERITVISERVGILEDIHGVEQTSIVSHNDREELKKALKKVPSPRSGSRSNDRISDLDKLISEED